MSDYRSKTSTHGRNMAGARALWRATGMKDDDFKKPIGEINLGAKRGGTQVANSKPFIFAL